MPPVKRSTTRKSVRTAKRATKKTAKRPGPRTLSATHKKALAEGRSMSSIVDRYLSAINTPQRRGRKVSAASLQQRLAAAQAQVQAESGVTKVMAAQEVRDLTARLAQHASSGATDLKSLESEFIKIAKAFSDNRGISYGAWRAAGVSAVTLKRARIARTRG